MSTAPFLSKSNKNVGIFFPLPSFTWKQKVYVLLIQGLGGGIVSFVINFLIAYNMYHGKPETAFWLFPVPVAGDLALTPIIQGIITFIIVSLLVTLDLRSPSSLASPLDSQWPRTSSLPSLHTFIIGKVGRGNGVRYYLKMLLRFWIEGGAQRNISSRGLKGVVLKLIWMAGQGLIWGVFLFLLTWPITMAILAPIYTGRQLSDAEGHLYIPEIMKGVQAFILGIIQGPLIAMQVMGRPLGGEASVIETVNEDGEEEALIQEGEIV